MYNLIHQIFILIYTNSQEKFTHCSPHQFDSRESKAEITNPHTSYKDSNRDFSLLFLFQHFLTTPHIIYHKLYHFLIYLILPGLLDIL